MTKNPVEQLTSEFDINDAPLSARNLLTRGHIQDEITQISGCAVTTRGRYMTPVERLKNTNERALYLYIQGPNKASLDIAIQKIDEIIRTEQMNTNNGPNNSNTMKQYRNSNQSHYQMPTPPTVTSVEKVYVGIENVSPGFDLRGKLIGVRGTNLNYIRNETGAIVTLRGKGSLFIDPHLGTESTEPLHLYIEHSKYEGLTVAKQLALNLIETLQQEVAQLQPQVVIQPQTQLQIYSNQQIYPGAQQNTTSPNIINFKPNAPPPQLNIPPPGVHIPQGPLITQTPPITLLNTTDMVGNGGLGITGGNNMIITNTGGQLMQTTNQSSMIYNNGNNPYQTLQFQIPTSSAQTQLRPQQFDQQQQQHIEQGQQHNFNQQNNQLITQLIPTQQMIQSVPPPPNTGTQQIIGGSNGAVGQQHGTVVTVPMHSQFQIQQPGTTTTQLQVNPQTGQLQQINTTMIPTSQHHQVAFQIPIQQQQQNGGQQYIQQQSQLLLQSTNQQPQQTIQLQQTNQQQIHQIPIQTTGGATVANTATIQQPMTIQQHQQQNQQYMTQGGGHHQIYATQQGLVLLQQNSTVQQQSISNYTTTIQQDQHTHGTHQIPIVTANINQQPSTINQQSTTINCIQQSQHDPTGVTTIQQQKTSSTDHLILEQMNQQHHTVMSAGANHHHQGSGGIIQHNQTGQLTLTAADHHTNQTVATGTFGGNNQLQLFQQSQQHILCDQNTTQNQHQDLQQSTNIQQQHNSIQFINQNLQQIHQQQNDLQKQNVQHQQSYLFMQPTIQTNNQQQHQITGLTTSGDGHPADQQHQITFIQSGTPLTSANGQQIQFQSTFPISIQQIPSSSIGGGIINTSNTITTATSSIASGEQLDNATLIQQPIDNNMIQIKEETVIPPSAPSTGKKRKLSETDNNTSSSAGSGGEMMTGNGITKNNLISSAASSTAELSSSSSPTMKKSGVGIDQMHTGKPQQATSNNNYNNQQKGNLTQCSSSTNTSSITSSSTVAVAAGNQKSQEKSSPQRHLSNQQWSQSNNGNNKPPSQISSGVGGIMLQDGNKWQNNQQWMSLTTMAVTTTSTSQPTNTNGGRQQNMANPPQVQQIRPNFNQQKYQQYLPGNQLAPTTPGLNTGYQQKNNQQRMHYNNNQINMQQVPTTLASSRVAPYPSATIAGNVNTNQHYLQTMNSRAQQQQQGNWQQQQQHPNSQFNNPSQQTGGWM
ncbi:protein kinase 4-like [Chrysoperla carnea]|uniref:protein kinase 4-like n=1 Tax=Chrysoperla carnea TaxID=189513 RepID=UPI001D099AA5|nr:protein kinase 4-like [Chrysoperla carnea]